LEYLDKVTDVFVVLVQYKSNLAYRNQDFAERSAFQVVGENENETIGKVISIGPSIIIEYDFNYSYRPSYDFSPELSRLIPAIWITIHE
jgi:hypothetical protein